MKIALAQLNYTIGDIDANANRIIESIRKAEMEGADLVVFAEYAVSGTPAYDLLRKTTFLTLCEEALERIAEANTVNYSLSNLDALVEVAAEEGYIASEWKQRILAFRDNPSDESWRTI